MFHSHHRHPLTRGVAAFAFCLAMSVPAGAVVQPPEPVLEPVQEEVYEIAVEHGPPGPPPRMHEEHGNPGSQMRMLRSLNLTPEQQTKFQAIHFDQEKFMIRNQAEVAIKRLELQQLLGQPESKESDVRAKYQEMHTLHQQAHQKALDAFFQIRNLLTPEQRSKLPVHWVLRHIFRH